MANEEHVEILKQGVEAWNKWRRENPNVTPYLRGANLSGADLVVANLSNANLSNADLSGANLSGANLSGADLFCADIHEADLSEADLKQAGLYGADLHEANLSKVNLNGADIHGANLSKVNLNGANLLKARLYGADLSGANLRRANLSGADLSQADLSGAYLYKANLSGTDLLRADLHGAELSEAKLLGAVLHKADLHGADLHEADIRKAELSEAILQSANFSKAIVDGETLVNDCQVDRDTNFELVGLGDIRIDSGTRQLLEYNVRRKQWDEWFGKGWLGKRIVKNLLVRPFWWMSDYGLSTKRIIASFFMISLLFAVVYANLLYFYPPGIIHDLAVESHEPSWHYRLLLIVRPVYFSVVTMTTLGFGDIFAEKQSILGHILLTIQVLLGYVMLGALVTRFAVLFTANGPADRFKPMSKEDAREVEDIHERQQQQAEKEMKAFENFLKGFAE